MFKNLPQASGRLLQKGFTLIELIVVIAIIGAILSIVAPSTSGSKEAATANQMYRVALAMVDNWKLINQSCGTNPNINFAGNAFIGNPENVLFRGELSNEAVHRDCYRRAGVAPIDGATRFGDGDWRVAGIPVNIFRNDEDGTARAGKYAVQFGTGFDPGGIPVQESLVISLIRRFSNATLAEATGVHSRYSVGVALGGGAGRTEVTLWFPGD